MAVLPNSVGNNSGAVRSANGAVLCTGTRDRGDQDTFLNAYADNGDLLWEKDLGVTGTADRPSSIFFDGSRWILIGSLPPDSATEAVPAVNSFAQDGTPFGTVLFS